MQTIDHWANNTRRAGTDHLDVFDPATGEVVAKVARASAADVDAIVGVAAEAASHWGEVSLSRRASLLFDLRDAISARADDIAAVIATEHGKTLDDARGEVARGLEVVEFACGIPHLLKGSMSEQVSTGFDSWSVRQPLGVVAGITPFNFPVMVPLWMAPLAVATGNSFVLKPSEKVPSASMILAEAFAEAGFPDGVFDVVHGDHVAVDAILDHPLVRAVSFVGSSAVAKHVYERATAAGKRVQALGGAKNHAVVMPDADLDSTVPALVGAIYGSSGQRCMAISAVVAVGDVADELVERLRGAAADLPVGPSTDEHAQMGPVISPDTLTRLDRAVSAAVADGAELVLDGRDVVVPGCEGGWFAGPCILDRVTADMDAYRTEVFGPMVAVLRVETLAEALELIAANPYGNGAAIFTTSGSSARSFQRYVQAGMVGINVPIPVPVAYYSFGGWNDSLFGDTHVHGPEAIHFYTAGKVVTSRWQPDDAVANLGFPTTR